MAKRLTLNRGFTVIEVLIAVVVLAACMVTLLGLQSSVTSRTIRDQNRIRAMLAAREILAAIEVVDEDLEPGTKEGSPHELVNQILKAEVTSEEEDAGLTARVTIQNVPIPDAQENALLRIDVTVNWGPSDFDSFSATYFIPGAEQ